MTAHQQSETQANTSSTMDEQQIQQNRTEYLFELRFLRDKKQGIETRLRRARTATTITALHKERADVDTQIQACHRTWTQLTGLAPIEEQELWMAETQETSHDH